jgi:hypothetical protein
MGIIAGDMAGATGRGVQQGSSSRKRQRKLEAQLTSGLTFAGVFGALLLFHGGWYWIFPLAFAGVMPALQAGFELWRRRRSGVARPARPDPQKEVLRVAREYRGRVTASMVALDTPLSIAESERTLDEMARHGHAGVTVTEDGRVQYEFREFLPADRESPA